MNLYLPEKNRVLNMNVNKILTVCLASFVLLGCALAPQNLNVKPELVVGDLKYMNDPVELYIRDQRSNTGLLGYRDGEKTASIMLSNSLVSAIGESVKSSLLNKGVKINTAESLDSSNKISIDVIKLVYSSPDKQWVNHINLDAELLVEIKHSSAVMKKRFKSNRSLDVATAPSEAFNEKLLNSLLSELISAVFNDKEIIAFLK